VYTKGVGWDGISAAIGSGLAEFSLARGAGWAVMMIVSHGQVLWYILFLM
jgi:hypothetical protein